MSKLSSPIRELREAVTGDRIFDGLVDRQARVALYREIKKSDEQTAQLYRELLVRLAAELEPKHVGVQEALSRVQQLVTKGQTWDADMIRNNVFKAANSLGMKLPSGSF